MILIYIYIYIYTSTGSILKVLVEYFLLSSVYYIYITTISSRFLEMSGGLSLTTLHFRRRVFRMLPGLFRFVLSADDSSVAGPVPQELLVQDTELPEETFVGDDLPVGPDGSGRFLGGQVLFDHEIGQDQGG